MTPTFAPEHFAILIFIIAPAVTLGAAALNAALHARSKHDAD